MIRPLSAIDAPFDSLPVDKTIVRSLHFVRVMAQGYTESYRIRSLACPNTRIVGRVLAEFDESWFHPVNTVPGE